MTMNFRILPRRIKLSVSVLAAASVMLILFSIVLEPAAGAQIITLGVVAVVVTACMLGAAAVWHILIKRYINYCVSDK